MLQNIVIAFGIRRSSFDNDRKKFCECPTRDLSAELKVCSTSFSQKPFGRQTFDQPRHIQ
jgi:hypothetical protein